MHYTTSHPTIQKAKETDDGKTDTIYKKLDTARGHFHWQRALSYFCLCARPC